MASGAGAFAACAWALLLLPACSQPPQSDLQYIKQARSLAAEWALVNAQAADGKLTAAYVDSMHQWLRDGLHTTATSLGRPDSRYGHEIEALLAEPADAAPETLRSHADALKQIEDGLESA
jgi:hypothetical protein